MVCRPHRIAQRRVIVILTYRRTREIIILGGVLLATSAGCGRFGMLRARYVEPASTVQEAPAGQVSSECPQTAEASGQGEQLPCGHHLGGHSGKMGKKDFEELPPMQDFPRFHLVPARPVFAPLTEQPPKERLPDDPPRQSPPAPLPGPDTPSSPFEDGVHEPSTGPSSAVPRRLATLAEQPAKAPSWVFTPSAATATVEPKPAVPLLEAELTPAQKNLMRR